MGTFPIATWASQKGCHVGEKKGCQHEETQKNFCWLVVTQVSQFGKKRILLVLGGTYKLPIGNMRN